MAASAEVSREKARLDTAATPPARTRRDEGKAHRQQCPRSSHARLGAVPPNRDVVAMIKASSEDRLENLIPLRYSRMLESPFAFFRGSSVLQASDLARGPNSGIQVQAGGDCHLMNFGGFATPERNLDFDVNDFDETFPAPWEWDVKRLCASVVLAARWRRFSSAQQREAANAVAARYREMANAYAGMSTVEIWYSNVSLANIREEVEADRKFARLFKADVKRAQRGTSEHVYDKMIGVRNGSIRIIDQPPLLFHTDDDLHAVGFAFFEQYVATLREDLRSLLRRYRLVDAAMKVVGVGSVGTRCYVLLLLGEQNEPLFLQVKEARRSVLEDYAAPSAWQNHGERVVAGQHLMQAVSDIFLGWSRDPHGRDFYVRQLRDVKVAVELDLLDLSGLLLYGQICSAALARAHAKAGQAAPIAGYIGSSTAFDDAIEKYALAYADQVECDFEKFQSAARNGEIPTESRAPLAATRFS
jgi:uncharacterized protein (DUF2252 family)